MITVATFVAYLIASCIPLLILLLVIDMVWTKGIKQTKFKPTVTVACLRGTALAGGYSLVWGGRGLSWVGQRLLHACRHRPAPTGGAHAPH